MAAIQIDIMKIRQLILLKSKGYSNRKLATEIGIDRNTANEYVQRLNASELSYQELLELDEKGLQDLFPSKEAMDKKRYASLLNLFPSYVKELKKPGCTRQHLWRKYQQEYIDHYGYSQFCQLFGYFGRC